MKKILLIMFVILLSSVSAYQLDHTDSDLLLYLGDNITANYWMDSKNNAVSKLNCTFGGNPTNGTPISPYGSSAMFFDGTGDFCSSTESVDVMAALNTSEGITFAFFFVGIVGQDDKFMSMYSPVDDIGFYFAGNTDAGGSNIHTVARDNGTNVIWSYSTTGLSLFLDNTPYCVILTVNASNNLYMYKNNSLAWTTTLTKNSTMGTSTVVKLNIGAWHDDLNEIEGNMSNIAIYKRALNYSDREAFCEDGFDVSAAPSPPTSTANPVWTIPPNNDWNNNTNITMNITHTADVSYSIYLDDELYIDNVSQTGDFYLKFTTNLTDGSYTFKASVSNTTSGVWSNNVTRTWILDSTTPTITILGNTTFKTDNSTIISSYLNKLSLNISFFDTYLYQTLINITNSTDESIYQILNTSIGGKTTANYTSVIDLSTFGIGNYTIKLIATDSHTTNSIDNYDVSNGINTITFNTVEGNRIEISSDGSSYLTLYNKKKDKYEFGWNYLLTDSTRKFTLKSDNKIYYLPDSEYTAHFVVLSNNLDGNWIDFEGIGKDYSVKKIKDNEYEITFINLPLTNKIISKSLGGLNKKEDHYLLRLGAVVDIYSNDDDTKEAINATATIGTQSAHTISNTSAATLLNITKEITEVTLNSTDYSTEIFSISITENYHNFTLNMTPVNAVKIYFYDEKSNTLIRNEMFSVYLETIGFSQTYSNINVSLNNPYTISGLNVGLYELKASSANYLEREYSNLNITNVTTTNLNVYLINSTDSAKKTFYVRGSSINAIEDVYINFSRIIDGTRTTIAEEYTDYDGAATLYLDENYEYRIIFSKEGYDTKTINLEPTNDEYIITLTLSTELYNASVYEGIRYNFEPSNTILTNNTKYNFTFTLNSSYWPVTNCTLALKNGSSILNSTSGFTSNSCYLRLEQNTLDMTNITSEAVYELDSLYNFTVTQQYSIIYTYEGEFSLKNFLDDLSDFSMAGFDNFGRMIIAFIVIFVILAMVAMKIGFENKETLIIMFIALVGFFSFVNWFYLDFAGMPEVFGLKKYFIFYLIFLTGGAFIWNKWRQ